MIIKLQKGLFIKNDTISVRSHLPGNLNDTFVAKKLNTYFISRSIFRCSNHKI